MSKLIDPFDGPAPRPVDVPQHLLGTFGSYGGAERLVDTLSDRGFPVQHVRIVGQGLRSIEYVTGRLTPGRAAAGGAVSGAWFGLLIGLVVGFFDSSSTWFALVLSSIVMGAAWFAVFGFLAQRSTHGRRDFASNRRLEAEQYQVFVDRDVADEAIRLAGLF